MYNWLLINTGLKTWKTYIAVIMDIQVEMFGFLNVFPKRCLG